MRVDGFGLVDRNRQVTFNFDGVQVKGFVGDSVASALLANGQRLMGRSFKYHRPRGVVTAGSDEPNALITVGQGAEQQPNIRATMQEIYDGLVTKSQNRFPSLQHDLMAVNDLAWPLLGAGFYYKTFMWPAAFWERIYEPLIRRAAGLGALSGKADTTRTEKAFAFCDLLVIGGGPSGLMAALRAGRAGADVILVDENDRLGGRLLSEREDIDAMPAHAWVDAVHSELEQHPNVRIMTRTTVTGAYDQGTYGALERVARHVLESSAPRECFWRIAARQTILASGASERNIAFANNDRPGVMMASALRSYLHKYGVSAGRKVAIFTNNDDGHRTARDLFAAGIKIAGVIDTRPDIADHPDWMVYADARVSNAKGRLGLSEISVQTPRGKRVITCDTLAISGGWNPLVHLSCHMNARPVWDAAISAFIPAKDAVAGMTPAGACRGKFSTAACLADGAAAAGQALAALDINAPDIVVPQAIDQDTAYTPVWRVAGRGRAWLDYQNDVTVKDVQQAAHENFRSVEHMKRYTTQGMATDQGKGSNLAALAILGDATGRSPSETGTTTYRPPFEPVAIAALGAGGKGKGFAPERLTSSDAAARAAGAPMIEAGLWYRPSYFPRPGETTWRDACDREVRMVRETVGICDVSTLGKIDIKGPDAAAFLDFLYTNKMSTLKPGRVRYGLMLREDGHVMDDGTCARLGEDHFVISTTTAAAGQVMMHIDFAAQALKPAFDVSAVSVTEHWAQFAIAGPKSRDLLNTLLDQPIDNESFKFMACGPVSIGAIAGRLFRISFSGEHAYEIAIPARFGASLYRLLLAQAESMGGGAYGMEALNVLRIEKGFVTHAEIHGRVSAFDVGMAGMLSQDKDFIGRAMAQRPGLNDPERQQLVGLRPVNPENALTAGAHLFAPEVATRAAHDLGYVTSVAFSPTLNSWLALAFIEKGAERMGQRIRAVDALGKSDVLCEVTSPVAFDPEGGRARG